MDQAVTDSYRNSFSKFQSTENLRLGDLETPEGSSRSPGGTLFTQAMSGEFESLAIEVKKRIRTILASSSLILVTTPRTKLATINLIERVCSNVIDLSLTKDINLIAVTIIPYIRKKKVEYWKHLANKAIIKLIKVNILQNTFKQIQTLQLTENMILIRATVEQYYHMIEEYHWKDLVNEAAQQYLINITLREAGTSRLIDKFVALRTVLIDATVQDPNNSSQQLNLSRKYIYEIERHILFSFSIEKQTEYLDLILMTQVTLLNSWLIHIAKEKNIPIQNQFKVLMFCIKLAQDGTIITAKRIFTEYKRSFLHDDLDAVRITNSWQNYIRNVKIATNSFLALDGEVMVVKKMKLLLGEHNPNDFRILRMLRREINNNILEWLTASVNGKTPEGINLAEDYFGIIAEIKRISNKKIGIMHNKYIRLAYAARIITYQQCFVEAVVRFELECTTQKPKERETLFAQIWNQEVEKHLHIFDYKSIGKMQFGKERSNPTTGANSISQLGLMLFKLAIVRQHLNNQKAAKLMSPFLTQQTISITPYTQASDISRELSPTSIRFTKDGLVISPIYPEGQSPLEAGIHNSRKYNKTKPVARRLFERTTNYSHNSKIFNSSKL